MTIQFSDRVVPYAVFLNDLADALAERIRKKDEPEYICQNEAFRRFAASGDQTSSGGEIQEKSSLVSAHESWSTRFRNFNGSKIPNKTISGSHPGRIYKLNRIEAG